VQLGTHQPDCLRQKDEKQNSGEKLGATEALAREESGH
jgi:hypothetical protein